MFNTYILRYFYVSCQMKTGEKQMHLLVLVFFFSNIQKYLGILILLL